MLSPFRNGAQHLLFCLICLAIFQSLPVTATNTTGDDSQTTQNNTAENDNNQQRDIFIAYAALVIMAIAPIYIGAWRSISCVRAEFVQASEMKRKAETLSQADVLQFPIYASAMLVGMYALIKVIGPEYVNMLVTTYIVALGIAAVVRIFSVILGCVLPQSIIGFPYSFRLTRAKSEGTDVIFEFEFTKAHLIALPLSIMLAVFYVITKHWIANNVLGLSFAITGIEFMPLDKFQYGAMLLGGLFVYDIFWVFGTDVMVTVAKNLDAPVKILFPRDFLENGIFSTEHAMLGLGDIVLPGALLALLLRFDHSRREGSSLYFNVTFVAYFLGLLLTILVMHTFQAAQPALLYLVPVCLIAPLSVALIAGEMSKLFAYSDESTFTPKQEQQLQPKPKES
eukprot:gene3172-5915_t